MVTYYEEIVPLPPAVVDYTNDILSTMIGLSLFLIPAVNGMIQLLGDLALGRVNQSCARI